MPDGFLLKNGTCDSSSAGSGVYPWARLDVGSPFLANVGNKLMSLGFNGRNDSFHVTLGYAAGIAIPWEPEGFMEELSMIEKLQSVPWRLVLLKMNNETRMIEKHDEVLLAEDNVVASRSEFV
jgi:hypothetical protein